MRVRQDQAYRDFLEMPGESAWQGVEIRQVRVRSIAPGGRARMTLFDGPHPRLRARLEPVDDPNPPGTMFAPSAAPRSAPELRQDILSALRANQNVIEAADLDMAQAPKGSPRYWKNNIRTQRIAAFFEQVKGEVAAWASSGSLSANEARRTVRELEDEVYATSMLFDDQDIGTYYSYRNDQPFVHYLERLLDTLPREGTEAFAVLPAAQQDAIRRQLQQLINHLDYLMRHKYAYELVEETDAERTIGGLLIDRRTRMIVSEVPGSPPMNPRYEVLRIDPASNHRHAGEWVYRDNRGGLRLQNGTVVQVPGNALRSTPVAPDQLTFRRAPNDPRLRPGVRLDWDDDGHVSAGKIDWVTWAGHCDVQGVIEELGVTFSDNPSLTEYRSDTDAAITYDRTLLLEMLASVLELGSLYQRPDGSGVEQLGGYHFGGARNDSRPDRLQFEGTARGRGLRWPASGRQDTFVVTSIAFPDQRGRLVNADMGTVYLHNIPDVNAIDFSPNPRFLRTVEGDYNLIDVSNALIEATVLVDEFDPNTGYPRQKKQRTLIDLRERPRYDRCFLGTYIDDVHARRLYKMYLDRDKNRIIGELYVYEQRRGTWRPRQVRDQSYEVPLAQPLRVTLSHEMRRDRPELFQALLDLALRTGQNICADTTREAPVWNGVVTRLDVRKVAENVQRRVQSWRVDVRARFGRALFEYMVRRNEVGEPVEYCVVIPEDAQVESPDFFYQEFPDVGTKVQVGSTWLVNKPMLDRDIISLVRDSSAAGGFHVQDDHIENVCEIMYSVLAGHRYSIVHDNRRYGFTSKSEWDAHVAELKKRRAALSFEP